MLIDQFTNCLNTTDETLHSPKTLETMGGLLPMVINYLSSPGFS